MKFYQPRQGYDVLYQPLQTYIMAALWTTVIGWLDGSAGWLTNDQPLVWTILLTFLKSWADNWKNVVCVHNSSSLYVNDFS